MSICFSLHSSVSKTETTRRISAAKEQYGDVLGHFWISDVQASTSPNREDDVEYGFDPECIFVIQWDKEHSELIQLIPKIFYEVFGKDKILIRDNNYDVVPPP